MAQPVVAPLAGVQAPLEEGKLRREIRGSLVPLNRALNQVISKDRITLALRDWYNQFLARINHTERLQESQNDFIFELQTILKDPLEERATLQAPVLGSDGITYAAISLRLALSRGFIPLEPGEIFSVESHSVAEAAIHWLQAKGGLQILPRGDVNVEHLPPLPTRDSPEVIALLEQRAKQNWQHARDRERAREADLRAHAEIIDVVVPQIVEGGLRREIRGFLVEVERVLKQSNLHDHLTVEISRWRTRFSQRIGEDADVQSAQNAFIALLQQILIDPIEYIQDPRAQTMLTTSFLGSDGETYGLKSLSLYLFLVPEEFRRRSPIHPDNGVVFIVQPHPVADFMLRWLQKKNALILSAATQAAYQQLSDENRLPFLPTRERVIREEQIRIFMQNQAEEEAGEAEELARFEQMLLEEQARIIQEQLVHPMQEEIQEFAERQNNRLDAAQRRGEELRGRLRQGIENTHRNIRELQEANSPLNAQLDRLDREVDAIRCEAIRLQIDINELRREKEERNSGWLDSALKGFAILGLCLIATPAIGAMLPQGVSGFVAPQVGGFKAGFAVVF